MSGRLAWDRREFMGTVGVTAVTALVPMVAKGVVATGPAADRAAPELLADWTIDDMFGVWPRYADPIPYGHPLADDTTPDGPLDAL